MGAIGGSGVSIEEALPISGGTLTDTLIIDQNANLVSLDIDSEATTADVVNITAPLTTTGNVLDITLAASLTTGRLARFNSNSASTATRDLVVITNDNASANGATCLSIQQDAAQRALFIDQNGNGISLDIDSESTTADVINITAPLTTTGNVLDIQAANALTTGSIIKLFSNSTDSSTRNLVDITNNSGSATGTACLNLLQGAAVPVLIINQAASSAGSSLIDFKGAAAANATGPISTLTTSGATTNHIQIEINGAKAWIAVSTTDPS